jgi:hypothetical protein
MSKIIDLISTAGAIAVTGFFIYKVILPQLSTLKFPVFQPPNISFLPQFPWWQQQQQPQQPMQQQQQQPPQTTTTTGGGGGVPAQAPAAGGLIWDSNTHGKWNNGTKRVVKNGGEGGQGPDGKGLHTAASGNPTLTIDGNGIAHLESSQWGRIYIYAKNYNSRLEGNFMFETDHGAADNISIKMRSRHSNNGHPHGGSKTFGGIGVAFHPDGEIEVEIEIDHDTKKRDKLPSVKTTPFQLGKWYKFSISTFDGSGGVNIKVDVDGKNVGNSKWSNPDPTGIDRNSFNADSYFWIRLNCHDGKNAKAAFSNLRLYGLGDSTTVNQNLLLMLQKQQQLRRYPYLFNSYYNRRRL